MADRTPRACNSAGHGMSSRTAGKVDPGAAVAGSRAHEAAHVLAFARSLDQDLAALFHGRPGCFHMLRDAGRFDRAEDEAAANKCDTFNEWHTDAGAGNSAKRDGREYGVMTIYEDPKDAAYCSRMAAKLSAAAGLPNRGAKRRTDLAVLNPHAGMTQCLVELIMGSDRDDVLAFGQHRDRMELAAVNVMLWKWGWRQVSSLPRLWTPAQRRAYRPF